MFTSVEETADPTFHTLVIFYFVLMDENDEIPVIGECHGGVLDDTGSVQENRDAGTVVEGLSVCATDQDAGDQMTFAVVGRHILLQS